DLFHARFDPARPRDPARETALEEAWSALLAGIENPDEDRILSRLMTLLRAVLRTNFYQGKDYLALKIDSTSAGAMPAPRPWREIFVISPRMEGCHLRAGPVARGGIRWSDRREDFRTEILGLLKTQVLKNVVIVPTGAKGGFVLKHPPPASDREAFQAEGVAAYRTLIRAMLDLTDNFVGDRIVTPEGIVRRDGDDPYIVAAADKGTAGFSDIANAISAEYGFWLGDAFASGGSAGYSHKGMGITARGAWTMIDRHFQETLGRSVHDAPFTCVGVGDMSGDVFGNGLLISRQTRLLAAFDHRHIFIDPDPDPEVSYQERARLFELPRSSWADYDPAKLSLGGGVYPRSAKTVPLSPQARALLGIEEEKPEPAAVIRAILKAPVDLLYFGGIGTYVKASTESNAAVGDRANDAVRVDGRDIRARIVGEGANLGVTQAGRIEYARLGAGGQGGRINTDSLDNSAGVSTSDHEVNIKILLADAMAEGVITLRQRDELLAAMTDEVAALVLRDNNQQSLAISLEALPGAEDLPAQAALIARLEAEGLLDRAVTGLPDAAALTARIAAGQALTRPEIAALLPFAKLWLTDAIAGSALPDDPALEPLLLAYFPAPLRDETFARFALRHRLRRELIATILANAIANRLGCAALGRLTTEASPARAARAAWLADAAFGLEAAAEGIDAAPAPAGTRLAALLALRRLQEAAARELLAAD
ncbi:MAG: NAD-glutamate dehydrogenase, partial [Acetobacteraceae bacterium]|nr:NAD-glutamate dehydrogenase [Acetobacteraceae bacterium]